MKRIFLLILLPFLCWQMRSQSMVDSLYLDMRACFHQETENGTYSSQLRGEHLNLHIYGHIGSKLDFRLRQRLNKKVFDEKNMFNATDMMYINWHATPKLSFLLGKYAVLIGGYEYDAAPIEVYYYSKFCNNLYQGFTFGVVGSYSITPTQSLALQVCNSPLSLGDPSIYAYNLAWIGQVAPWWKTIWTFNYVEDHRHMPISYISLGNHFILGKTILDIDVMNRGGFGQRQYLFSDMTLISKFIWSVGNWNICAKAGYEWNDAGNVNPDGEAYDLVIEPGTKYAYWGGGLEWFPLGRKSIRLHAVYFRDNDFNRHNLELGLTWRIDVIKK